MSKIKIFALGGLNESGKNMYITEVDDNIFIFDAGLKYPTANMLGVDKDAYKQYENVKIGGCIDWGENDGSTSQILRIW